MASFSGTLVNEVGNPVANATCEYTLPNSTSSILTIANSNGEFSFSNVPLGGTLTIDTPNGYSLSQVITQPSGTYILSQHGFTGIVNFTLTLSELTQLAQESKVEFSTLTTTQAVSPSANTTTITSSTPVTTPTITASTTTSPAVTSNIGNTPVTATVSSYSSLITILIIITIVVSVISIIVYFHKK